MQPAITFLGKRPATEFLDTRLAITKLGTNQTTAELYNKRYETTGNSGLKSFLAHNV